jgi:hypothetical protein
MWGLTLPISPGKIPTEIGADSFQKSTGVKMAFLSIPESLWRR